MAEFAIVFYLVSSETSGVSDGRQVRYCYKFGKAERVPVVGDQVLIGRHPFEVRSLPSVVFEGYAFLRVASVDFFDRRGSDDGTYDIAVILDNDTTQQVSPEQLEQAGWSVSEPLPDAEKRAFFEQEFPNEGG